MRRFALMLALALSTAAVLVGSAGSAHSSSSFQVFVDETTSASATGVTLVSELEGTYDVVAKTASGDGTYEVWAGGTELDHGTFALTRLIAFQFYGCGEVTDEDGNRIELPPDFCGGRALFAIHYTSFTGAEGNASYEVNCQIHDPGGQAPPGTSEGVKVNARGVNFNRHVTGDNLFVMLP
ncbi:MAG: hypothetical protein E6G31_08865 [Actinobacteria bacterium]|jgi:hypothetical protein|nr:MAG: hypothetical protein E6G31_08865 [Actinomycetota bacterium]